MSGAEAADETKNDGLRIHLNSRGNRSVIGALCQDGLSFDVPLRCWNGCVAADSLGVLSPCEPQAEAVGVRVAMGFACFGAQA
jgi:hypothetical protein